MTHQINTMPEPAVRAAVKAKGTRFATVSFVKKSGELRKINGLFRATSHMIGTGTAKRSDQAIPIWSPRDGWRSFRVDSVIAIA